MKLLQTTLLLFTAGILSACGGASSGDDLLQLVNSSDDTTSSSVSSSVVSQSSSSSISSSSSSTSSSIVFSSSSSSSLAVVLAPDDTQAIAGDSTIRVSWQPVAGAVSYNVYYARESFSALTNINDYGGLVGAGMAANILATEYLLESLLNETVYFVVVTTVTEEESVASEEQQAMPLPTTEALLTGVLNDTGIVACSDYEYDGALIDFTLSGSNMLNCEAVGATFDSDGTDNNGDAVPGGQDALYGRDTFADNANDGHAGFSFTQLSSTGIPLPETSNNYLEEPWFCVRDHVTGLVWEVKTIDGIQNHNADYSWFNSTGINDGGAAGSGASGSCVDTGCDTEKYVAAVNAMKFCGAEDWRLPTKEELLSLVNYQAQSPAVDVNYFPNTHSSYYWTATPVLGDANAAYFIHFRYGNVNTGTKSNAQYVRLVRGAKDVIF